MNLPNSAPAGAFDGLSGETHSTSATMLQGAANTFVQVPMTRLRANLNAGMLPGVPTAQLGLGDAAALPQAAAQPLWAQVFGNWGTMRGDGNAAKTTQTDSGITIGGDHAIGGGWRLGGALGYTNNRSSTGERGASAKADSYSLTIYGGKAFDLGSAKLNFSLGTAYTWHDMSTRRNTDAAGLPQTLEASYRGNTAQVFTELGYAFPVTERVTLEPFVGAGYSSLRTRAFTESGGDAALRGDSNRNNVATTTLGLHARSARKRGRARSGAWHAGLAPCLRRRQPGQHAVLRAGRRLVHGQRRAGGPRRGPGRAGREHGREQAHHGRRDLRRPVRQRQPPAHRHAGRALPLLMAAGWPAPARWPP